MGAALRMRTFANNWLQARPGFAFLFVLAPRPGLPEPKRSASTNYAQ
jgi:hypothetical protein